MSRPSSGGSSDSPSPRRTTSSARSRTAPRSSMSRSRRRSSPAPGSCRATPRSCCTTPSGSRSTSPSRSPRRQGLTIDRDAFDALLQAQRATAKADAKAKKKQLADVSVYGDFRAKGETVFTGYDELETPTTVLGIIVDGVSVDRATAGQIAEVILAETSLYAESGGQEADAGRIVGDGFDLEVLDVQRPVKGLISHTVQVTSRRGRCRAMPRARWSTRNGGAGRPRRTRRPTSSTPRCARSSGRRRTSPARTTRPATCASTSAGTSRCRRRPRPRSRRSPTTPCATTSR